MVVSPTQLQVIGTIKLSTCGTPKAGRYRTPLAHVQAITTHVGVPGGTCACLAHHEQLPQPAWHSTGADVLRELTMGASLLPCYVQVLLLCPRQCHTGAVPGGDDGCDRKQADKRDPQV